MTNKAGRRKLLAKSSAWRFQYVAMACLSGLGLSPALADEVEYKYDALGRLVEVERSDGIKTIYTLDAAGNRTEVKEDIPPSVPASISVPSSNTSGSYTISWTAPATGAPASYQLYESTSSNFTSQTQVYTGTATSRAISGKGNGLYYYRVRACNTIDCSDYKAGANGVQVTPGAPGAISLPTDSSTGSYSVSWGAASGSFTAYELYEATNSSFSGATLVHNASGTSFSASGRGNGVFYYRVRACGTGVCGAYSTAANSITVAITPPPPVSISVPTTTSSGDYTVAWGASPSGTVTAYELYEATDSGFASATRVHNSPSSGWSVTGKATGTYYYRVRACNNASCSSYVTASSAVSVDRTAPTIPGTPAFTVNGTTVNVSWSAASDNIAVTGYETRLNGAATWTAPAISTSRTLSGLTEFTGYTFEVRARDAVGNVGPASSGSFTTGSAAPPQPSGLNASLMANCAWNATWSASSGATYYIFKEANAAEQNVGNVTSKIVNCPYDNPDGNKPQWVKACNSISCSNTVSFFVTDTTAPTQPGVPVFSAVTHTSATATWSPSTDANGVAGYRYRLNSGGWTSIGSVPVVGLAGLTPSTNYTFEVQARDGAGNLSASRSASLNTPAEPDTTSPSQPGALTISDVTYYNARATWVAATDNVGVTAYEYRLNNASTWTGLGNVLTVVVTGLNQLTTYTFEVRARDGSGNVGASRSGSITTTQAPPAKPTGLWYSPNYDCWRAGWNPVNGAAYYKWDGTGSGAAQTTTSTTVYLSCPSGNPNGNRPEWVQTCNSANVCGERAYF